MKTNLFHFRKCVVAASLTLAFTTALPLSAEVFNFSKKASDADTVVVFQSSQQAYAGLKQLDKATNKQITQALEIADFTGKSKEIVEVLVPQGIDAQRVLVVGLGSEDELNEGRVNNIGAAITAKLSKSSAKKINILTNGVKGIHSEGSFSAHLAHGINLRAHKFDKYLKEKNKEEKQFTLVTAKPKKSTALYQSLAAIEKGVFLARDLTSEVPTEMNPVHFAAAAKELEKHGVKVTILKADEIKKLGMGALHAVGRGSSMGSRLVIAQWQGNNDAPIALVGKGITFDSGGYSIKTGSSIARMKSDMAGAAAVLGTVKAMALQKADVNVVAVMGMAANMVSESSVAPGDVVKTAEGLTVEILNTDAEGRLVLSDALWYARDKYQPSVMIDVATLTGSKVRALGNRYTAIFSEDEQLVNELTVSGKAVDEKVWRLPLGYKDMLKSPIADLRNTGSGGPGATTAATFLQQFTGDTKWAHLDIAGNALIAKPKGVSSAGGTGHGVRLLSHWILTQK